MNHVTPFQFDNHNIRVVTDENGEPLFVGKDICDVLGYTNHNKSMQDHCRGVTKRYPISDNLGRMQDTRVINEADMLRLVVNSTLPAAQEFERLVFEVILPTIRRTGRYEAPRCNSHAQSRLDYLPRHSRQLNSMINRRAYELALRMVPGLKVFLMDKLKWEQETAIHNGEKDVFNSDFAHGVLMDCEMQEALYDLRENI